jgi:hypothetical protein
MILPDVLLDIYGALQGRVGQRRIEPLATGLESIVRLLLLLCMPVVELSLAIQMSPGGLAGRAYFFSMSTCSSTPTLR